MDSITFCIPYYGKEIGDTDILSTCIANIRNYYPTNPIVVCKTSDSHMPTDVSGIEIHTTFVDGSHIFGAIELLTRICKTKHFLICHDSMFLRKPLPPHILHRPLYPLWHFNESTCYFYDRRLQGLVHSSAFEEKEALVTRIQSQNEWNGIFGPAFGGTLESLKTLWDILHIRRDTIAPYLGRDGLMASERLLAIVFIYMGFSTEYSLNGNIYKHPDVFKVGNIPDFSTVLYDSYFYKIWRKR